LITARDSRIVSLRRGVFPQIHLRSYQPADFETLYRVDQACFPKGIAYGRMELKTYLRAEGSHCLLAETSGEVAGYILTGVSAEIGHIVTLDVLESLPTPQDRLLTS